MHFFAKKFGHVKKKQYLCSRFSKEKQCRPPLKWGPQRKPSVAVCGGESGGTSRFNAPVGTEGAVGATSLPNARGGIAQLVRAHDS